MPLDVDKWPVGVAFLACGIVKLGFLLFSSNHMWLRRVMALLVAMFAFWAGATTFDFFRLSQTSLQLPLTYMGLAALGFLLLIEPFTNPATEKGEK